MRSVNVREVRQRLSDIVDAAERGQSVRIRRHGRDVAQVGPVQKTEGSPLPDLTAFRKSLRVGGKPLSKIVVESRE